MRMILIYLVAVFVVVQITAAQHSKGITSWQGETSGGDTVEGIVWMPPVQLSPDSILNAYAPSVEAQGDTIHVTWCNSGLKFPYLRSTNGGRSFEPLRDLLPDSLGIIGPCWLISAGKRLHGFFFYSTNHGTNYYLYSMFSDDAGTYWSTPKKTETPTAYPYSSGAHGDTVVFMQNADSYPAYTTDGGNTWGVAPTIIWGLDPFITLANGTVHLVKGAGYMIPGYPEWLIQYKRSMDLGNSWPDSMLLYADPPASSMACIAGDSRADTSAILTVWRDEKYGCLTDVGCGLSGTWSFDNGTTWLAPRRFDVVPAGCNPTVAVQESTFAVIWYHDIPYATGPVLITMSTNSGQSWTTPYALLDSSGSYPSSLALSNGIVHVVVESGKPWGCCDWRLRIKYRRGIILSAQHPRFTISTNGLSFNETIISCKTSMPVVVKNTGGAILDIQSVVSEDSNFTVTPANGTINSYDSLIFNVSFTPKSPGLKTGKVIFSHNAQYTSGGSTDTVSVFGIGTESGQMSVVPRDISFGVTTISCGTSIPITTKNNFCAPLVIESQILDDSSFIVTPTNVSIDPSDSVTFIVTFQPASTGIKSGRIIFTHNAQGSPDTVSVSGTGMGSSATEVITNYYGTNWQMVSLPVEMLCPYTASNLFTYTSSYEQKDTMVEGSGYWQKLNTPTLRFVGYSITDDTFQVKIGWNMIGSISSPVAVNDIQSIPGGVTISNVFGYNGINYFVADTIYPGRGYWVKVSGDASLILSALEKISFQKEILSVNFQEASRVNIVRIDELPPPPPASPPKADKPPVKTIPNELGLEQNYPNPFNPATDIRYQIPARPAGGSDVRHVTLKVYDLLGREIVMLVDAVKQPGYYTVKWNASGVPSGVYLYRLNAGDHIETKKLVLMR